MADSPEVPEEAFCREIIETRAATLVEELSSLKRRARSDSIHVARVASRRLRAALEAFKDLLPPRPWRALYDRVREVTKALGRVRETEINLALIKDLTPSGDMAENICREYLHERFQRSLSKRLRRLTKKLRKLDIDRIHAQTEFILAGLGPGEGTVDARSGTGAAPRSRSRRAVDVEHQLSQPSLFQVRPLPWERGRRISVELSQPIRQFRPRYDFRRASDERLHELRIAAKKLRYTMEIFDSIWPGGLKKEIALSRELQDAVGHYHDWCVLRDRIQAEIRRLTKQETTHLSFQMGRLLAQVEERRLELRKMLPPVITHLRTALKPMLSEAQPGVTARNRPRVKAVRKP
jgi:CHAD domain-containing protein